LKDRTLLGLKSEDFPGKFRQSTWYFLPLSFSLVSKQELVSHPL